MVHDKRRRVFLGRSMMAGVAAAFAAIGMGKAVASTPSSSPSAETTSQVFNIRATNNLHESPIQLQVYPEEVSPPIRLSGGFTYRVKVSPLQRVTAFGKAYRLQLLDGEGKPIDEMNVGSNTTATFKRFGVQIYLLSVQQGAESATAET